MDIRRLKSIRHLALDMDGTIYRGGTLFEYTPAFLARLDALDIGYTFITNNSSRSVADYVRHLARMGIAAGPERIYTSALCTIDYLRQALPEVRRLYLVGTASLAGEFTAAGFDTNAEGEPDAVVVGFDPELHLPRLGKAAWWLRRGKPFIATHPDRVCPTDQPTILIDCGSICAALESATGRRPDAVLGKPDAAMLTGILRRHGLAPDQLAMVGDRLYTDMVMARHAGALGILVLTGEATQAEADACPTPPELVVPTLKELGDLLAQTRA